MAVQHVTPVPYRRISGLDSTPQAQIERNFDAVTEQLVPTGTLLPWAGQAALAVPSGWALCDGQALNRVAFSSLFKVIGTEFGAGDGVTTFNVPNMSDRFPRGTHLGSEVGDTGGSSAATMPNHSHGGSTQGGGAFNVGHDQNHGQTGATEPPNHGHAFNLLGHSHSVNSVVFMNCSATHGHGGGCGQLAESPSYGGCTGFGCNGGTGGNSDGGTTAGVNVSISHSHTGPPGHSNHSVSSHTHLINAEGSGDNNPPYMDFRFIIKT